MKRLFYYTFLFIALGACNYDDGWDGYKENLEGGQVEMIIVSPSSAILYIDSKLPTLSYYIAPWGAVDTVVTWTSDKPEVLNVNATTGVLEWGTPANTVVTISAISNSNSKILGKCVFTIRNSRGRYRYVDLRKQAGIWMLDRNLEASTKAEDGFNSIPTLNNTWYGNYYQYGNNNPVANLENGGEDGQGGNYNYENGRYMTGGFSYYDPYWDNTYDGFVDWSVPNNLPVVMEGWRLPTKNELEKLAYWIDENNFRDAAGKGAAKVLRKEVAFGPGGLIGGERNSFPYSPGDAGMVFSAYIWSSDYDPVTQKAWVLKVNASEAKLLELSTIGIACPIRLVCDAANFDEE